VQLVRADQLPDEQPRSSMPCELTTCRQLTRCKFDGPQLRRSRPLRCRRITMYGGQIRGQHDHGGGEISAGFGVIRSSAFVKANAHPVVGREAWSNCRRPLRFTPARTWLVVSAVPNTLRVGLWKDCSYLLPSALSSP
jgi:hypothetical protein